MFDFQLVEQAGLHEEVLKMDFNSPTTTIHWIAKFGWCTKIFAATLVFACVLNFGCESEPISEPTSDPIGNSDSQGSQPAASSDPSDSGSKDKKSADAENKKTIGDAAKPSVPVVAAKPPEPDVNDARFHAAIKAAAKEYLQFAMVNTDFSEAAVAKVAPEACGSAAVILEEPGAKMSRADSDSKSGHSQKLYFLFAKDIGHYLNPDDSESPTGQVLVKESWTAVPGNPDARNLRNHASGNRVNPRVMIDGKTLKLGKRKDLFVMLKQDPDTEATDEGWVYGVIDSETYKIKSAGAVASCIACHEGEKDHLFRDGIIDWNAKAKELSDAGNDSDPVTDLPEAKESPTKSKVSE